MLREFVEFIAQQSVAAAKPDVVDLPNRVKGVRLPDGTLQRIDPLNQRDAEAMDLTAIIGLCKDDPDSSEVWYCRTGVAGVENWSSKNNRVTLTLDYSPQLKWLQAQETKPQALSQRDVIFKLRTLFSGSFANADATILAFRSLTTTAQSVIQPGKVSVGRALASESAPTIPDSLAIEVPIWASGFNHRETIRCLVEPDPAAQTFQIIPLAREIERAIVEGEKAMGDELRAACGETPVYYGVP